MIASAHILESNLLFFFFFLTDSDTNVFWIALYCVLEIPFHY